MRVRRHISFANVMSLVAVMIALGGTSYAALKLPKNSVGANQIKAGAVGSSEIKNGSVAAKDIKRGVLPKNSAASGSGVPGPAGPTGRTGPAGATGPQGPAGTARAFARIDASGTLIGGAAQAKGVTQTMIQHAAGASAAETAGTGVYCIGGLGFDPTSVLATPDNTDSMPGAGTLIGGDLNVIATAAVFKGEDLGYCDATHGQIRVAVERVNNTAAPTLANHGFLLWIEG